MNRGSIRQDATRRPHGRRERDDQRGPPQSQSRGAAQPRGAVAVSDGLNRLVDLYMENISSPGSQLELEIRFGTLGFRTLTHNDHSNVIDRILSSGYRAVGTGDYHLRIHYENMATEGRKHVMSNNRFELDGMSQIQRYCTTNELDSDVSYGPNRVKCTRKTDAYVNDEPIRPVKFNDFNFKVSLQRETNLRLESAEITRVIHNWPQTKKSFRYMKRTSFESPDSPIRFDISVVKESKRLPPPNSWMMETTYTFDQADVVNSPPKYEIEIEIDNTRVGPGKFVDTPKALAFLLRRAIKLVLSGLQGTNFPVPYSELQLFANDYHYMLYKTHDKRQRREADNPRRARRIDHESESDSGSGSELSSSGSSSDESDKNQKQNVRLVARDFIGPSSVTLQRVNVSSKYDPTNYHRETSVPNIRHNYTVTDKADGQRKMMFVNGTGRIYLIDTAMNIQFTGMVCRDDKLHWSLLDGEHIMHSKTGEYINMYAAFDIYFIRKVDIRHLALAFQHDDDANTNTTNFRLYYLSLFMADPKNSFHSVVQGDPTASASALRIVAKRFRVAGKRDPNDIFACCTDILNQINDGAFTYNTDGLIFTPADTGVGMFGVGGVPSMKKCTWALSFKWKPVSHNTIDFLVTTDKNEDQSDIIHQKPNLVTCSDSPIIKYKTLTLRVGYSIERDGSPNPLHAVLDGVSKLTSRTRMTLPDDLPHAAVPFFPTAPYDPSAHICNIVLHNVGGIYQMRTESGEVFTDKSVVEFRYDKAREPGMRWIPIKVRHDKTLARESGNAFHVANNNWYSLHYPVEERMLKTPVMTLMSANESSEDYETGVYYQKSKQKKQSASQGILLDITSTKPIRDFHNKFVKRALISSVAKRGMTLIDFACGKGGDISKWIDCELRFVLGIDISEDNITNQYDGAYVRYLNYAKYHSDASIYEAETGSGSGSTYAVFVKADSSNVLREMPQNATDTVERERETDIYHAIKQTVFGERHHDAKLVGDELSKYYGVGREGFDVSSIQFALHYLWKDVKTLHTFMRNVSECTKVGGHFIGTCYDGRAIFNMLKKVPTDGTVRFEDDSHRIISSITKRYKKQDYFDDESSLGYAIDVFAESINAMHTEYLVNMVYLERIMRDYGFELLPAKDTQRDLFLPRGHGTSMGSFRDMFDMMTYYVKGMTTDSVEGYEEEFDMEASSVSLPKRAFPETHPMKKFRNFMHTASSTTPMNIMSGKASEMTDTMKAVSFVNNYFVFKKVQHIDAKTVSDAFIKNDGMVANAAAAAAVAVAMVESSKELGKEKKSDENKEKVTGKEKEKELRVRKQIDGVVYVMDTETGELFKTAQSKDPIGKLKISSNGKRKEIEFVNDEYAAKHQLQKEKAAESSEKKRKHKDVEGPADK